MTVNVILVSRLLWGPQSLVSYRELASQHAELLKERDSFDAVNAGLSREIRLLQSDEKYVEKMIRHILLLLLFALFDNLQDMKVMYFP